MSPLCLARRPARLAAGTGLVLLVTLASLPVVSHLRMPPAVRTVAVGRLPTAVGVDARTRRVFVANLGSNTVSMLDAASGAVLATIAVAPHPSALAVATTAGRVFVVCDDVTWDDAGQVSVLDPASGRLLRTVAVGRGVHTIAVHERTGRVFVTNAADDSVSLLEAHSGRLLRTIPVGQNLLTVAVGESLAHAVVATGGLRWYNGYPVTAGTVRLLDARSGAVLRTVRVGQGTSAVIVDAHRGRAVIANSYTGTVSVLDARSGAVVRTVPVGRNPGALAVDERTGQAFVANRDDNSVSLVDAASGRVVRTVPLGLPPRALAVDQRRGRVVVLTGAGFGPAGAGQVQVLNARTGRLLHTVAVGADATALAVDERTGHAFVTAMNLDGLPAGSDGTPLLRAWLRRWLPQRWVPRLLPPPPVTATGTVTMLDLARL